MCYMMQFRQFGCPFAQVAAHQRDLVRSEVPETRLTHAAPVGGPLSLATDSAAAVFNRRAAYSRESCDGSLTLRPSADPELHRGRLELFLVY